jgi:hypothetical protein
MGTVVRRNTRQLRRLHARQGMKKELSRMDPAVRRQYAADQLYPAEVRNNGRRRRLVRAAGSHVPYIRTPYGRPTVNVGSKWMAHVEASDDLLWG